MSNPDEPHRYSHPTGPDGVPIPIQKHLNDVAKRIGWIISDEATTPNGEPIVEITKRIALVHDTGKLTSWFQQHIGVQTGKPERNPTHHAPLGALLAYYVLDALDYAEEECLIGLVAVGKHHGTIPNVVQDAFDRTNWSIENPGSNSRLGEVVVEAHEINQSVPSLAELLVRKATDGNGSWKEFFDQLIDSETFPTFFKRVHDTVAVKSQPDQASISRDFYACVLQVWSALVLADKTGAASVTSTIDITQKDYRPKLPDRGILREYITRLQKNAENSDHFKREQSLNRQRKEANRGVRSSVEHFVQMDKSVATITLPTGLGKTLTGLDAALKIRNEKEGEGRIIYALPYTSIIDQVVEELKDLYRTEGTDRLLTVHHSLAETVTELDAEASANPEDYAKFAAMIGESWRSGLVVTTFVQLFGSLASPRNTQSMKLPALYGSVVILDEPQTLPQDWWPLIERLVEILTEEYNSTVIAMTATQPNLFNVDGNPPYELVQNKKQYFSDLSRVKYVLDDSVQTYIDGDSQPLKYDEAAAKIIDEIEPAQSVLAVCNTIDSTRELSDAVKDSLSNPTTVNEAYEKVLQEAGSVDAVTSSAVVEAVEENDPNQTTLLQLTTRIRPCDRLTLIQAAKKLCESDRSVFTVSTQLIEAGVDISFDRVYRDFAPMDSIVQAAGRCNRSFERDVGTVTIWLLETPEDKEHLPAKAVYGLDQDSLPKITGAVLASLCPKESNVIPEEKVAWTGVRKYYDELDCRGVGDDSYVDYVNESMGEKLGRLSIIDQKLAIDVLVIRTEREYSIIESIKRAYSDRDFDRLDDLMAQSREMQVSVPIYSEQSDEAEKISALNTLHNGTDVRWLTVEENQYENYFNSMEGLVVPDSTVGARIL